MHLQLVPIDLAARAGHDDVGSVMLFLGYLSWGCFEGKPTSSLGAPDFMTRTHYFRFFCGTLHRMDGPPQPNVPA